MVSIKVESFEGSDDIWSRSKQRSLPWITDRRFTEIYRKVGM